MAANHNTSIEWTHAAGRKGETWNPVTGCSKVSPGCAHSYAETCTAMRAGKPGYIAEHRPWTPANAAHNVTLWPERLDKPLRWKAPRMVFVNSMSDLFHEEVPFEFTMRVFDVMEQAHWHVFQVLTKRPERMLEFQRWRRDQLGSWGDADVEHNVWLGVSVENRRYVHRADVLRETPAAVRFISAEPLLGPLIRSGQPCEACGDEPCGLGDCNWGGWPDRSEFDGPELNLRDIDWLIVGGESGPGHRPMKAEWVRDLLDGCLDERLWGRANTSFFFKQWGGATPKAGGRLLDGRTWDEMPTTGGTQ